MANKTFGKISKRSIKGSLSRFLSIVSIVALGVGFLAGLLATTPDMRNSANDYFAENRFYDFYIQSTVGFSEDDVKEIKEQTYVKDAVAIKQEDQIVKDEDDESLETRIFYVDLDDKNKINNFVLEEGRMPKDQGECVIEVPNRYSYNAKLNSIYTTEDGKEYKAVGIVSSPMFLSTKGEGTQIGKGSIVLGMYLQEEADTEVFTAVYGLGNIKNQDTFSAEYEDEVNDISDKLKSFGEVQVVNRIEQIKKEAQEELDKNKATFESEKRKAKKAFGDSEAELKANENTIRSGKEQIADGIKKIDEGLVKLQEGQQTIERELAALEDNENKLLAGKKQLEGALNDINVSIKQIEQLIEQAGTDTELKQKLEEKLLELNSQKSLLQNQYDEVNANLAKITAGKEQINANKSTINANINNLKEQRAELLNKQKELQSGEAKLKAGWSTYYSEKSKAEAELAEAEAKLNEAQKEIDDIKDGKWIINTRLDSNGVSGFENDVEKVGAIAKIFPVFFFLVAALVVLTTMTRMIEEERMQVGTLKSLGYPNSIIRNYYLKYGFFATVIGSVFGLAVGFNLFPRVISNAYRMMYNTPPVKTEFIWELAGGIVLVTLICIMSTIFIASRGELKEKPASLMQPKAPAAGKRILLERVTPLWRRLKFTRKVALRNLFRYKKRFLMTIIGVAGCFALLITGFGVRDSIGDIVGIQYGEIFKYDITVSVDRDKWTPADKLDKEGFFAEEKITVKTSQGKEEAVVDVPESESTLKQFVDLRTREGHKEIKLSDEGIVLSEKLCEELEINIGDTVEVTLGDDKSTDVTVTGICENYVMNRGFMTANGYEEYFGESPEYNTLFATFKDYDEKTQSADDIVEEVMAKDDVQYALATETIRDNFSDSVKNIDYIVMVLILSAGALSVIVLYNLTNINICERKKELATIKVLGFYEREVSAYIFREINLLAFIGIIIGIPAGIALHTFVIKTAEVGGMMFGRDIYWRSYVFAVIITVLFTALVNLIMRRSIRKIDMVESMKAND